MIEVDGLTFDFPATWLASKYDNWTFYRKHFETQGNGIKAVDLLAISDRKEAFAIEVKNYNYPCATMPSELPDEFAQKVRDTLAAMLPARLNANVDTEKSLAADCLSCRSLTVVLHIEQRHHAIDLADLKQKLRGKLRAIDPHPKVVSAEKMLGLPWKVT
jgi:hypothetical protein